MDEISDFKKVKNDIILEMNEYSTDRKIIEKVRNSDNLLEIIECYYNLVLNSIIRLSTIEKIDRIIAIKEEIEEFYLADIDEVSESMLGIDLDAMLLYKEKYPKISKHIIEYHNNHFKTNDDTILLQKFIRIISDEKVSREEAPHIAEILDILNILCDDNTGLESLKKFINSLIESKNI